MPTYTYRRVIEETAYIPEPYEVRPPSFSFYPRVYNKALEIPNLKDCCLTCKNWIGNRRKMNAWCNRLNCSTPGDRICDFWEKKPRKKCLNTGN